ncbi:hypothetical protein ACTQ1U_05475 [Thermoguttaceae bacterium LCP21S3_D4]
MSNYTGFLEDVTYDIFEEEDYVEELKKAAELFRTFDKALDSFIVNHGYDGDLLNVDEKVSFITGKLKAAGVPVPRNIKKWYSEHKRIERKTAFQLCFAFGLQVDEVDDFLRRVCLTRGFDCHDVEEVVYFFALKNGLSYEYTVDVLSKVTIVKPDRVAKDDIVYTEFIAEEIDDIETAEELILYLNENVDKFGYNNATAYEIIRSIWNDISKEDGIALREKRLLYVAFDKDTNDEQLEEDNDKKRKERKRMDDSLWEIYLQILGLSGNYTDKIYKDRSIKSILIDNELLHPIAEDSFPDRGGLNKILNGEHVSYERVRKLLILLVFYKFWANKALCSNHYVAGYGDADRCISTINDNLVDAGYPMLYPGNPYDFIIFFSVNADNPLMTFRDFMQEMFFSKMDSNGNSIT